MLIDHSSKTIDDIRDVNGGVLWGERLIYERIFKDCTSSPLTWHLFYDSHLPLPINGQAEIQIDFFLLCPKGIIIIEVKGGQIEIRDGKYYNSGNGKVRPLKMSPFDQAESYKWAIFNNHVLSQDEVFISTACAFPSASLNRTSNIAIMDKAERLWTSVQHDDAKASIADFCLEVIESDRQKRNWIRPDFTTREMEQIKDKFAPTISISGSYTETSLQEILDWLKADNIDTLESLSKNNRIFIEGGPGTGKTTIAKAYIQKYSFQKGLYLCWNQLLAAKITHVLKEKGLTNCDVERLESFLIKISDGKLSHDNFDGTAPDKELLTKVLLEYKRSTKNSNYSYIIIDELHDTLDLGALEVIDALASISGNGLRDGRYLVFFDGNQGYNSSGRRLEELSSVFSHNAALFTLSKNKRVPTNLEIVEVSNQVRDLETYADLKPILSGIEDTPDSPISISHFRNPNQLLETISQKAEDISKNGKGEQYILLTHSNLNKLVCLGIMTFSDVLKNMSRTICPLTENNINSSMANKLPWTSILRYKGLERNRVILAIKCEDYFNCFELFIGMSRTIMSLELLILD